MKIFFPYSAFYPSQIGGPCNTLYWHACALKNNDVKPVVFTTNVGIEKGKVILDEWIENDSGKIFYSTKGILNLSTQKTIAKEISKTDILHLNSLFNPFSIFSFLYKTIFHPSKPTIWSVRGEVSDSALKFSSWKKKPVLFLYKRLNKSVIYHSTSNAETKGISKLFPRNEIVQLPNLILPANRLIEPINENLLFVGRIHHIKGLHYLIKGLSLSEIFINSDFKLNIVGKQESRHDNYKEELQSLVRKLGLESKVIFRGYLEGDEKEKAYASSYALILPSYSENFGNVVLESLNQGTPVIASKGTPWKILEKYNAGFHVSNEPSVIAKYIDKLLLIEKDNYNQMRNNSYKLVDDNFRVDLQIHKWIEIYKKLLI